MSRKLHKILGYYVPAFFEMHVDTDADDLTINKLNHFEMTVLFHEYIHFLQDFATYYGLNRIYVYSEYMHSVINRIYRNSSDNKISVPIKIEDNADNVLLNQQIQKFTSGDDGGEYGILNFTISDIIEDSDPLIDNPYMTSIPNVIVSSSEGDVVIFGATAITESMAYIMERLCSPAAFKKSPSFPYGAAEMVADYYVPHFSDNPFMVLALCDMSQMSSNPGACFVRVMKGIQSGQLSFNSPEEIYDHFYDQISMTMEGEQSTLLLGFQRLSNVVKQQLKNYLRNMSILDTYYEWIDRLFNFAWEWRKNDRYFLLKMARHHELSTNRAFEFCIYNVGTPLMSNNKGNYFKTPPNGMKVDTDVEYFKAFSQIEQLFSLGLKECSLYEWCCKSPQSTPSELCLSAPWKKVQEKRMCPYALLWKHWNLSKYDVV